ncbi:uncharacterized protein LOC133319967 [Danaus plexippus]|uniref:uncharacterized protein LOC133319967 n=1 Tax=Danaus plexippus TaxID=13037 RepID=UPI002AAF3ACD|nr:uncharacterized protein LOC133319967 [Danaus plexippus]
MEGIYLDARAGVYVGWDLPGAEKSGGHREDQLLVEGGVVQSPDQSAALLARTFFADDDDGTDSEVHAVIRSRADLVGMRLPDDTDDPQITRGELRRGRGFCRGAQETSASRLCPRKVVPPHWTPSILGKIFEKILCRRIRWHVLPKSNARQYGFTPQRSTEDTLYDLMQHVRGVLSRKETALMVSLDIEGAFDNAWWPAIKCRMIEKGIPVNLRRLVEDYFRDRSVAVHYAGRTVRKAQTKGCVQGSIGGPLFWNMLLDPLLDSLDGWARTCRRSRTISCWCSPGILHSRSSGMPMPPWLLRGTGVS